MNLDYRYPLSMMLRIAGSLISGKDCSFKTVAQEFMNHQPRLLKVQGREFIPEHGPCVVTFNHYHREGFHAWWLALAVASIIPREIHWIVTNELTFPKQWYGFAGRPISRWILQRLSKIFGFTAMPPMPPRPIDAAARASAVRHVLKFIEHTNEPMIGLAPEGSDQPGGLLSMPASGSGRFGLLLASKGLRFSPIGIYESAENLILTFGPQYNLHVDKVLSNNQKEQIAARIIMQHIADLLPYQYRGDFE